MADTPKATPMTLEEAVDHVECCPNAPDAHTTGACCKNARAIVDQAVRFIKLRAELDAIDAAETMESTAYLNTCNAMNEAEAKLRALERGESEVQP